jgi:hypothetical protein
MARLIRRWLVVLLLAGVSLAPLAAEDAQENGFAVGMGLGIGVQTYNEPGPVQYQSLALTPDFSVGKFGIGVNLTVNYRFVGDQIVIRQADWVPTSLANFVEIYLPKLMYVRWGLKGEPLYVKAGSMDDMTLGNGFLVANYANTLYLPSTRIFGLAFDMDGALFGFPFVGMESFIGNLAAFDVMGARLYVRPLLGTEIPVVKDLEVGGSFVADTRPNVTPDLYTATGAYAPAVLAVDGDLRLPIISGSLASLAAFGDVASILNNGSMGGMVGLGGKLIGFLTYGAQLRLLGPGFVPTYFGPSYDTTKAAMLYPALTASPGTAVTFGWLASLGTSFLDDKIVFLVTLDAPFYAPYPGAAAGTAQGNLNYPHLRGIFVIADGIIPGISLDFEYDKKGITAWADLVSAQDALIQAKLNYTTGPATISLVYQLTYSQNHTPDPWVVTSGLQSSIKLF